MNPSSDWLTPDWPAPAGVRACVTTRAGGVSLAPFDSLNLGDHVEDAPLAVAANRQVLVDALGCRPAWLKQVHSPDVVEADPWQVPTADASWSATPGTACAVLTADCLPALFCDRAGTRVAAAHAGWRGLAGGVLENTVAALGIEPAELLVQRSAHPCGCRGVQLAYQLQAQAVQADLLANGGGLGLPRHRAALQHIQHPLAERLGFLRAGQHAQQIAAARAEHAHGLHPTSGGQLQHLGHLIGELVGVAGVQGAQCFSTACIAQGSLDLREP